MNLPKISSISDALALVRQPRPLRLRTASKTSMLRGDDADAEEGFTIMELLVAMSVLMIMSLAVLSLLMSAMRLQTMARARTIAAQIAERTLEEARSWEIEDFTRIIEQYGGKFTPSPIQEGPLTFQRSIEVSWEEVSGTSNPAGTDYLRVTVEVTWNDMGSSPPVRMTTFVTGPPCEPNAGYIEVRVTDHALQPVVDVRLDLYTNLGISQDLGYTNTEGEFVFPCIFAGNYEITGTLSGYIGKDLRDRVVVPNVVVSPRQVTTVEFQMARPATLVAHLRDQATNQELTSTGAVSVGNTSFGPLVVTGNSPLMVQTLWPDSYSIAGSAYTCPYGGGFMSTTVGELPAYLGPGINTVDILLAPGPQVTIQVTVLGDNNQAIQGAQVVAIDGCFNPIIFPPTNSQGRSQRSGLTAGPYTVGAIPPSPYQPSYVQIVAAADPTAVTVVVSQ